MLWFPRQAWGLLEAETGNVSGARRLLEACLQECPQDPAPLTAYARMERLYGALDAARGLLKRATYLDPHHEPAWMVSTAPRLCQPARRTAFAPCGAPKKEFKGATGQDEKQ